MTSRDIDLSQRRTAVRRHWLPFLGFPVLVMCLVGHAAEVVTVLNDFESAADVDRFAGRLRYVYVAPSAQFKTSGGHSCEARFFTDCCSEGDTYIRSLYAQGDYAYRNWSAHQQFGLDVYNPQANELPLHLSFADGKKKSAAFKFSLKPGTWTPVHVSIGDLKAKGLDVSNVIEICIFQKLDEMPRPNRLYLDHVRLIGGDEAAIGAAKREEDATAGERRRKMPERGDLGEAVPQLAPQAQRTIRVEKDVPVVYETDVVVVGGGFAGTAAAVAAAREGAKVLLIERAGCLGGMATSGLVPPAMNLAVTEGIARELHTRCMEKGGPAQNRNPEIIKQVLYDMVVESGAKLMLYTLATGAIVEKDVIKGVFIESKSGT
ncbi:MAG: FAD-dependent oxidoreductase, partial [Planctomycetes bacterium]|nr:FAD-dependent oxidoreductase [Planctomycetota bacterium]